MRVAGFDIGTNSVRVLIGDTDGLGGIHPGIRIGFATRLGEGLSHTGRVSDEALDRTARVLGKSARLARAVGTTGMKAGATHVLRVASNAQQVLDSLENAAGFPVKILSEQEEAYYAYVGAFSGSPGSEGGAGAAAAEGPGADVSRGGAAAGGVGPGRGAEVGGGPRRGESTGAERGESVGTGRGVGPAAVQERRLLIDIGGGSVTLTQGRGLTMTDSVTLPIGAVTLTEKFLRHDPPTAQEMATLNENVQAELSFVSIRSEPGDSVVAVGGAATCMAALSLDLPSYDSRRVDGHILGLREVEWGTDTLADMTVMERERIGCLGRRRAEIAVAGAVVLGLLMKHFGLHTIVVSIRGLRYGLALEVVST